ncbi:MAG: glucosamine-6-phosphate deaminase [Lactovum sp.]
MKIIKVKNQEEAANVAFDIFQRALEKGAKVLGLATGSTPIQFYKKITESNLNLSDLISINLDEYVGLDGGSEQSYRYFMQSHLFNIKPLRATFLPNGKATDLEAYTKEYDQIIEQYPIDWQILGLGQNGHIGFNEPGTSFETKTHLVDLTPSTITANARFFEKSEDVPSQAISMGIASIMQSKEILLMAFGESKALAVKGMIEGEITEELPASILQKHPNVTIILDDAAASLLS